MWEHHRGRVRRHTGFPADRRAQPRGIHPKQHQVGAAGIEPVGGQVGLLRRRKVDESDGVERVGTVFAARLGQAPIVGAAEVNQDRRGRPLTASLPAPQHGGHVRQDTPVDASGTRPDPKTSETVDLREQHNGGVMTATLTSPELTRADRCDRCGAAARVRAKLPSGGELLFCQHHANEHEAKLIELAAVLEVSPLQV
jgi:hypothetical protein